MNRDRVVMILSLCFVGCFVLYAQSDRSCRGVEQHVIEMKLAAIKAMLPAAQAQQFQDKKNNFEIEMQKQFALSKENDQKITNLMAEQAFTLANSDAEFKRKVLERVKQNDPGLSGQDLVNAFAYVATHDSELVAELKPHLLGNSAYDAIATQMLKDDIQGTRTENLQLQFADKIPSPDYDQDVTKAASQYIATSKMPLKALSENKPFQDLLATVAYGQAAVAETHKGAATAEARARWDSYAPDVAHALESSHGVLRGIDGETREAQLIIDHLDKVMPPAADLNLFMKDSQKQLPSAAAAVMAGGVQALLKKSESARVFRNIEYPAPPSPNMDQEKTQTYVSTIAKQVKEASDTVENIWHVVVDK